jgi:hypothetical protein
MSRSLYYVGGLVAMLLVVLAQPVITTAATAPAAARAAAPHVGAADPSAIDDLAAWPAAAGR